MADSEQMTVDVATHRILIDGHWVDAVDGAKADVVNPATGETIAEVPDCTAADVDRAVAAAKRALPDWRATTPGERSKALLDLADALDEHAEELAVMESQNVGKPLSYARDEVTLWTSDTLRFFAGAARCVEGPTAGEYVRGYTSMIRREPLGVVGLIVPWNYPLLTAILKVAPALAAGNCCVLKPSEQTPLTAIRFGELASEILPPGVVNIVTGYGDPVGTGIVNHPDVRMVSLTGDVATGREIARAASATLKRVHLELGGKAPVIVLDDADPKVAAAGIKTAGYWNSGQECAAACRVIAGPQIFDSLVEELVPAVESIRMGDPASGAELDMGPVISEAHRERVLGFVERAQAQSAEILTGGVAADGPGFFIQPTVITGVDQDAEIIQREVFGPVVTVQRVSDEDHAIAYANAVEYGLSASVWTNSASRAFRVSSALEFGTVWINDHLILTPEMPFGGFKGSGYGKEFSSYSLAEYSQVKHVMAKW